MAERQFGDKTVAKLPFVRFGQSQLNSQMEIQKQYSYLTNCHLSDLDKVNQTAKRKFRGNSYLTNGNLATVLSANCHSGSNSNANGTKGISKTRAATGCSHSKRDSILGGYSHFSPLRRRGGGGVLGKVRF